MKMQNISAAQGQTDVDHFSDFLFSVSVCVCLSFGIISVVKKANICQIKKQTKYRGRKQIKEKTYYNMNNHSMFQWVQGEVKK